MRTLHKIWIMVKLDLIQPFSAIGEKTYNFAFAKF